MEHILMIMKKRLVLMISAVIAAASMFALNGCIELSNGTGVLTVCVYDPMFDYDVEVFPYTLGLENDSPIAYDSVRKGRYNEVSFTLNAGDYIVYCGGYYQAVQVQEGDEVTIYFEEW